MITAISNFKENNSKSTSIKQLKDSPIYSKQLMDNFAKSKQANQISFKGNLTKVGENLLGDAGSNLGKKLARLLEETVGSARSALRKLKGQDDLPFTKKPLIAPGTSRDTVNEALSLGIPVPAEVQAHPTVSNTTYIDSEIGRKKKAIKDAADKLKAAIEKKEEAAKNLKAAEEKKAAAEKIARDHKRHHHEDYGDNSDNLNHHNGQPSFGGEGSNVERTSMDDFISHSNNAGAVDSIPNTHGIGTGLSYENLNFNGSGSQALEHSTDALSHLSDIAEKHDIVSDALDGVSDVAEKVADFPGAELAGGVFLGVKFAKPIKDALNGDFEKAGVRTFTRVIDTALVPVKWIKSGVVGTIKGLSLKAKHIKSESTGVLRGINTELKKWTKGRNNIEDEMLGVEKLTPQERFERVEKEKQKVLDKMRATIQTQAKEQDDIIAQTQKAEVGRIKTKIEQAEETVRIENKRTAFYQKQKNEAQAQVSNEVEAAKIRLNKLMEERDQLNQSHQESINEIATKIKIAKNESNESIKKQLEIQLQEIKNNYKLKLKGISENIAKVTKLIDVHEKLANKARLKGFSRIAGYNEQKDILLSKFSELIKREQLGENVDIPNAVLFYGPKGNGKTTLTAALADHLDCNFIKIGNTLTPEQDFSNLRVAAEKAKENFSKDGTRTIISIDEFDYFADKSNHLNREIEEFIENISKDYHCTIFATTNNPQDIGQQILRGNLFHKMALGPANKENAAEVLKYYAEDFANPAVNYDKLAELISTSSQFEAYSNSRLASIVTDLVTNEKNLGKKLSQNDLQNAISNAVPDISKENLKLFNEQVQYCNKLTADNSSPLHNPTKVIKQSTTSEVVKPATIDEQANQAYTQYAHKLATDLKLESKEALIRAVLPDLMTLKNNDDALKAVLEHITPQNKEFIVKAAVPAILRNSEILDLGKAMGITLKSISPDTVDCLDKLAANVKVFKIKSQGDSLNILKALTGGNKDFALNDLFPFLLSNSNVAKYKINRGGIMAKFLDVVTPQNKDFVLNEALPILLKNSEVLSIDIIDALKIVKHLNKNNLKNVQAIANDVDKLGLKNTDGFLDIDKFVELLSGNNKQSQTIQASNVRLTSKVEPKPQLVKPATIEEQANQAYAQYAHKLATDLKLESKEVLIKEVLPDLMILKNNNDALKEVLEYITLQNKDFVAKVAVPAILRNSEALDLRKAMGATLKAISPDTVDCLDKLAANAIKFKIKSQSNSTNLLSSLTKENKDFAIEKLFPYLAENMDKYKIRHSGIMAKFLDVVTPQNKDFVLNEALPILLKNSEALNIDIIDALKITKHLNKNNLKNVQAIVDNVEKLVLKDNDGFLNIDKFVMQLENK